MIEDTKRMIGNLASRLRRMGDEAGYALVPVLGVMIASLGLASVAAIAASNSLEGTSRDEGNKTALQAADAGAHLALVRQNRAAGSSSGTSCMVEGPGGVLYQSSPEPDGWCAEQTGVVDAGTFSYRTRSNPDDSFDIAVTGESQGVERRLLLNAQSTAGTGLFSSAALMGEDFLRFESNVHIFTDVATNGSIAMNGNSNLCGVASVGVGQSLVLSNQASHGGNRCDDPTYPVVEAPLTLPSVQQGDARTNNSNHRFFSEDIIGGQHSRVKWNPLTRELELTTNVSLTLGGEAAPYSFCKLKLGSGTSLLIAAGKTVGVFFDSPENCNYGNGVTQLEMSSNSEISVTGSDPTDFSMLFVGSDNLQTKIQLNSNLQTNEDCTNDFIIYAPKTDIVVNSNATYCGAVAGNSVLMDSNAEFKTGDGVHDFVLPGAGPHYTVSRFLECDATIEPAQPDAAC